MDSVLMEKQMCRLISEKHIYTHMKYLASTEHLYELSIYNTYYLPIVTVLSFHPYTETQTLLMVLIPTATICLVLLLLVVFFCCCCQKRAKKYVMKLSL